MNILALALLGIAKKIFGGENKSHGIFSFSWHFDYKKGGHLSISGLSKVSTEIDKSGITGV